MATIRIPHTSDEPSRPTLDQLRDRLLVSGVAHPAPGTTMETADLLAAEHDEREDTSPQSPTDPPGGDSGSSLSSLGCLSLVR